MSIGNWYRVGTVAVTNGSVNVVGTGTFWTSQCNPGDRFTVDGENWYEVYAVNTDTSLTLLSVGGSGAFAGATGSNLAYAIDRNFTNNLNANIAASVASLVAQYQANSNGPLSGLFGNGAAATPGIGFLAEASTGLFHPATGSAALAVQGAEFLRAVGTAAGVPAMLGLGLTTPANALDVFTTNNALYGARIQNASAGTSARAALQIGNTSAAAQVLNLGVNGASFTANGVLAPSRGFVEGPNGVDFASAVTSGTAFSWGVGAGYAQKMSMDYQGDVAIGGSPVTVAGYTTLTLNNAMTGGIIDLQAAGVDVGRLTGSTAAMDLSAIGAAVPLTLTTNGAARVKVDTSGRVGVGVTPSAWGGAAPSILQVGSLAVLASYNAAVALGYNYYYNGANPIYQGNGYANTYFQINGTHIWQNAPSGTAGGTITFTTAMTLDNSGRLGINATPSNWNTVSAVLEVGGIGSLIGNSNGPVLAANLYYNSGWNYKGNAAAGYYALVNNTHQWFNAPSGTAGASATVTQAMTLDGSGNLLVGTQTSSGSRITVSNGTNTNGASIATFLGSTVNALSVFSADTTGASGATTVLSINKVGGNSRSVSAAGTINASGADYSEYRQLIASLYGAVAKGALLGYNAAGLMTNVFADVVGRVLPKSTTPSYVGNDTWGTVATIVAAYGVADPGQAPAVVSNPGEDGVEEEIAAYTAYVTAEATYQTNLTAFNAALETERVKWDRIALCGVVPVNISGLTVADIGKYLVPCGASDGTITGTAVAKAALTLGQYIDSIGTIEMISADGRPLVNVKNG